MNKFVSALAVLALVGGVTLTGCKGSSESKKGVITVFDSTAKTATIDGTDYTVVEDFAWPEGLATGDSVEYVYTGTVISSLNKIASLEAHGQELVDSTAAALDSAGAAVGAATDSAMAGAADALQGAANTLDSAAKH